MLEISAFSHAAGLSENTDRLCMAQPEDGSFCAFLCDDKEALPQKDRAESCLNQLLSGIAPPAVAECLQSTNAVLSFCAVRAQDDLLEWANMGDVRLYVFSGGVIRRHSIDDSDAYHAYLAKELPYAQIRMDRRRSSFSSQSQPLSSPHTGSVSLTPGDALLLCSDGFWQYVFETEMEIDLAKAADARDWLRLMLLRLCQRSLLNGDSLSAVCCICQ